MDVPMTSQDGGLYGGPRSVDEWDGTIDRTVEEFAGQRAADFVDPAGSYPELPPDDIAHGFDSILQASYGDGFDETEDFTGGGAALDDVPSQYY